MTNYIILTLIDTMCAISVIIMAIKEQDLIKFEDKIIDILKEKFRKGS